MSSSKDARPVNATFSGVATNNITKGLPKIVESICPDPECRTVIPARMFAEGGKVYMEKTCATHGYFKDLYWSDVDLYLKAEQWEFGDNHGLMNPNTDSEVCPRDCGICQQHTSHTVLGNIDLTNRCNLTCPICFANANVTGRVYEPSKEQVLDMLRLYRAEQPVSGRVVQFSGGEPTIHPDFIEIVAAAKAFGYTHIQAASNGIKFADPDFTARAAEAGLHTIYLQFDGVDDHVYEQTRGRALLDYKLKTVEHQDRPGADDRGGHQRGPGREDPALRARQHRRDERHQLPAGRDYRPRGVRGARAAALHAAGPRARARGADRHPHPRRLVPAQLRLADFPDDRGGRSAATCSSNRAPIARSRSRGSSTWRGCSASSTSRRRRPRRAASSGSRR
jgi:hypothetical protein